MKLPGEYAQALLELSKEKSPKEATDNLIALLKEKGHSSLLPSILEEYLKASERERDSETIVLTIAKTKDASKFKAELQEHMEHSDAAFTKEVVDETIIGGYILEKGEMVIDASYKKKLLLLYQSAIA